MRDKIHDFRKHMVWLAALLGLDAMFVLLLWLVDTRAFWALALCMFLGSAALFGCVLTVVWKREKRKERAFLSFLAAPDKRQEEEILRLLFGREREIVQNIGGVLRENREREHQMAAKLGDYEEYVEAWTHEIKTPISLLTFLLDNRREELPVKVCQRLDYIRNRMQESVDQMLYYARLKSTHKDYLYETLPLAQCCREVVENYQPLMDEKQIQVDEQIGELSVFSDERGLEFLLSQIMSNAVKYSEGGKDAKILLDAKRTKREVVLRIADHGIGVRGCDLPFIFEKGFTGDTGEVRKKATGMGLYLAREMADDLKITLEAHSKWQDGFEMLLHFPVIE